MTLFRVGNVSKCHTKDWAGGKDDASWGQMESIPQPLALQASALATKLRRLLYDGEVWKESYIDEIP